MGSAEEEEDADPPFEALSEGELAALPDARLVGYIAAAREAGEMAHARMASGILAYAFEPTIRGWVRKEMGSRGPEDVEDVVMEVLVSVVHSSFDGKVVGEFGSFLKTISKRRVVDYFRQSERHGKEDPLLSEHLSEEDVWGDEEGTEDPDSIEMQDAIERVLEGRNGMHRKVIRLYGPNYLGFLGFTAGETAAEICGDDTEDTVTEANVHQIWKRFKTDLGEELGLDA